MPRKAKLITKPDGTEKVVEAPSELLPQPVEFLTMQEFLAAQGMSALDVEEEEPEIDEGPKWTVAIDGLPEMEAGGTKFSVFTTGEATSGQMVIEFKSRPGVNRNLFSWLSKPSERGISMVVDDHEGNRIESWKMRGVPVALALDELDQESKDPWYTTFQVTVKDIQIT